MSEVRKIDVGIMPYNDALELQRELFTQAAEQGLSSLVLVEHPHVYTLGKSGKESNILFDQQLLQRIGAEFVRTDRGGDITYHGYGQLVGYPILNLDRIGLSLRQYIEKLEQSLIDTVTQFGICAGRSQGATGVWVGDVSPCKIAAIGVKASRGVTMHGFALNVTTDLSYFSHINPCGFIDRGVTSLQKEGVVCDLAKVKQLFCDNFQRVFGVLVVD